MTQQTQPAPADQSAPDPVTRTAPAPVKPRGGSGALHWGAQGALLLTTVVLATGGAALLPLLLGAGAISGLLFAGKAVRKRSAHKSAVAAAKAQGTPRRFGPARPPGRARVGIQGVLGKPLRSSGPSSLPGGRTGKSPGGLLSGLKGHLPGSGKGRTPGAGAAPGGGKTPGGKPAGSSGWSPLARLRGMLPGGGKGRGTTPGGGAAPGGKSSTAPDKKSLPSRIKGMIPGLRGRGTPGGGSSSGGPAGGDGSPSGSRRKSLPSWIKLPAAIKRRFADSPDGGKAEDKADRDSLLGRLRDRMTSREKQDGTLPKVYGEGSSDSSDSSDSSQSAEPRNPDAPFRCDTPGATPSIHKTVQPRGADMGVRGRASVPPRDHQVTTPAPTGNGRVAQLAAELVEAIKSGDTSSVRGREAWVADWKTAAETLGAGLQATASKFDEGWNDPATAESLSAAGRTIGGTGDLVTEADANWKRRKGDQVRYAKGESSEGTDGRTGFDRTKNDD